MFRFKSSTAKSKLYWSSFEKCLSITKYLLILLSLDIKELFTNLMPTFRSLNRTTHRWVRFLNECYALNMARCQSCWINKIENTLYFSISMILCHLYGHLASNLISQNASDVRSNDHLHASIIFTPLSIVMSWLTSLDYWTTNRRKEDKMSDSQLVQHI